MTGDAEPLGCPTPGACSCTEGALRDAVARLQEENHKLKQAIGEIYLFATTLRALAGSGAKIAADACGICADAVPSLNPITAKRGSESG
jgi:hypothetical protein